jgi:predicted nucleotidyltransferase
MSAATLADALFSRTRSGVFRELFSHPQGVHLRELERRIGVNSRQLLRELRLLRDAGILTPERVGNLVLYRFNKDCPVYDEIQSLARKTVGLADVVRQALEPFGERVQLAYIFGSFARGEERADSDVDLMIVGSVTRRELATPMRQAGDALGREISTMVHTPKEYARALEDGGSFVGAVHTGPRLDLVVDSHRDTGRDGVKRRIGPRASAKERDQAAA